MALLAFAAASTASDKDDFSSCVVRCHFSVAALN